MTETLMRHVLPDILGLDEVSFFVAEIIGFVGVAVMAYGAACAAIKFLFSTIYRGQDDLPHIRITLGKHLALGLEFLVGKDIIESIVHPSWDDLGKLAAIIVLRTSVTFMLSWELKEIEQEMHEKREAAAMKRENANA